MEYYHILISDGNEKQRRRIASKLESSSILQTVNLTSSETLNYLQDHSPDLVICLSSPRNHDESFHLVKNIRNVSSTVPILFLARHCTKKMLIAARGAGVQDFLQEDCRPPELLKSIHKQLNIQNSRPESAVPARLVGDSPAMRQLKTYLTRVAMTESTVLLTGETGTGKEGRRN